jgi:hypothetical protein
MERVSVSRFRGVARHKAVRKTVAYFSYCLVVSCLAFAVLEWYATSRVKYLIENSVPIFQCVLCDGQNIMTPKAHYSGQWKTPEFSVGLRTNSKGYREDFDFDDSDVDIAFMGDSFTFGWGVNVEDRYSNIVARKFPRLVVVSLSPNNGFEPEHYEYFLDRHPKLKPKLVFVGLYLGNDLDPDLSETVVERDGYGKIKRLELPYRDVYLGALTSGSRYRWGLLASFVRNTYLGKIIAMRINRSATLTRMLKEQSPARGNRESTELGNLDEHNFRAIRSLKEIKADIERRNGKLFVLLIPEDPRRLELMRALIALCVAQELKCYDLSRILTRDDYYQEDGHWNKQGHENVGNYVGTIVGGVIQVSSSSGQHPSQSNLRTR